MKLSQKIYNLLFSTLLLLALSSCGEDRSNEAKELQEVQYWIYETMEKWYYWEEDLPNKKDLNFFEPPKTFFNKLLSENDGHKGSPFSYIENKSDLSATRSISHVEYSYGMEFIGANIENQSGLYALVNYIVPHSPAEEAGIKRGDLIFKIGGQLIDQNNIRELLHGPGTEINVIRYSTLGISKNIKLSLPAARSVEDDPIKIIRLDANTGYLMYNHFTPGTETDKNKYDNKLVAEGSSKLLGVSNLILDLRYNNGGLVSSAEVLLSLICPSTALNKEVGYMEYNKNIKKKAPILTSDKRLNGYQNLNIQNLYVITGPGTASASELIINSLQAYMNVHVIGSTTIGKNVGSIGFDKNDWHIQPIVCKIFNSDGLSDYSNGFSPGIYYKGHFTAEEDFKVEEQLPLGEIGNKDERLLSAALRAIYGYKKAETRTAKTIHIKEVVNSQTLKRTDNLFIN